MASEVATHIKEAITATKQLKYDARMTKFDSKSNRKQYSIHCFLDFISNEFLSNRIAESPCCKQYCDIYIHTHTHQHKMKKPCKE